MRAVGLAVGVILIVGALVIAQSTMAIETEQTEIEPNNDPTEATAIDLSAGTADVTGTYAGLDEDWFAFQVREDSSIVIDYTGPPGNARIRGPDLTTLVSDKSTIDRLETTAPESGTYYLQLRSLHTTNESYSFSITVSDPITPTSETTTTVVTTTTSAPNTTTEPVTTTVSATTTQPPTTTDGTTPPDQDTTDKPSGPSDPDPPTEEPTTREPTPTLDQTTTTEIATTGETTTVTGNTTTPAPTTTTESNETIVPTTSEIPTTTTTQPGFGFVVALLALFGAGLIALRESDEEL